MELFSCFLNGQCEPTINNYMPTLLSMMCTCSQTVECRLKIAEAIAFDDISLLKGSKDRVNLTSAIFQGGHLC